MADLGKYRLAGSGQWAVGSLGSESLSSLPTDALPTAFPGSTPGVIDPVPILYPMGGTPLGFLCGQLVNAAAGLLPLAGGLITGNLAVGAAGTHRFDVVDGNLHVYVSATPTIKSGAISLHLDKPKTTTLPHCLDWSVGGVPTWGLGQDFDTNNADNGGTGGSDFVLSFDYTANAGTGADCLRISSEGVSAPGQGCRVYWGYSVGTPRANTEFLTLRPGPGVGGMRILANDGGAGYDTLVLATAQPTTNRVSLAFADHTGDTWTLYQDVSRTGALDLQLNDARNNKARLVLLSRPGNLAAWGFGGGIPGAVVSCRTSADPADYETVQRGFTVTGNDDPHAHSLNIEQIRNATVHNNYLWYKGGLDATSTCAAPVSSSGTSAFGWECQDTALALLAVPAGTVALTNSHRLIRVAAASLGFFGAAAITRPTVSGSKNANAALTSLIAQLVSLGLITDTTT